MFFDLEKEFALVGPPVETLRGLVSEALKLDLDPGVRAQIQDLSQAMESSYAEAQRLVPGEAAQLKKDVADLRTSIEKAEQQIAEAERQLAATQSPMPSAPPKPLPALDPRRGRTLRDELLQRFGPPAAVVKPPPEGRDVHEMTSGDFREKPKPVPPAVKPSEPPEKPRNGNGKDTWGMSSGAWEKDE